MSGVVILKETELPVEAMTAMITRSQEEGFHFGGRLLRAWKDEHLFYRADGESLFLAHFRGAVIGCCGLLRQVRSDPKSPGLLEPMYVMPAHRRQGVGSQLLDRALRFSPRSFVAVDAKAESLAARGFLAANGFVPLVAPKVTHRRVMGRD